VAFLSVTFFLSVALARWRRSEEFDFLKVVLFCAGLLVFMTVPVIEDRIKLYLYKYPGEEELLASRTDFWERTIEEFQSRSLFGHGFGVQRQMEGMRVGFTTIGQREQGSTFLALLEEVGVCGGIPIFIFFSMMGYTSMAALWRARDPLELLFSRVVFVGLSLAAFENYLLSLGNATSILVVFSLFCKERLAEISRMETSPGEPGEACASAIPAAPCPEGPSGAGRRPVSSADWRPSSSSSSLDIP
jgi:O-antigen ligase